MTMRYEVGVFFFSSRRRHTRFDCDWSSDVCSSDLSTVLAYGFKRDLNAYLADFGPGIAADGKTVISSLADVIAFNNAFVAGGEQVGLKYGQDILLAAQALDTRAGSSEDRKSTRLNSSHSQI